MTFARAYGWFAFIALLLFIAAGFCYSYAFRDPRLTDQEVTKLVTELDSLYSRQPDSAQKRKVVIDELMQEHEDDFMRLISGHLAEAFILAGVMILSVEGLTRYMAGREQIKDTQRVSQQFHMQANRVSANVWNAIFARLVPEQIATEIKRILKSDVCRIRPQYTVILTREPYENIPAGYIVVRRQLYYRLLNLTGGEVIYPITIKVLSHTGSFDIVAKSGSRLSLPRICELKIQGGAVSLGEGICTTTTHSLSLPKMDKESEAWEVYSEVEELCRVSDRNSYVLTAPCYGLELQVINQLEDEIETPTDTVYLTSGADPLRMTTPGKWVTESGLLSGTTLSLSWRARAENVNNA